MSKKWYVRSGERTIGPVPTERVIQAIASAKIGPDDRVCEVGASNSERASVVEPFAALLAPPPPPPPLQGAGTVTAKPARHLIITGVALVLVCAAAIALAALGGAFSSDEEVCNAARIAAHDASYSSPRSDDVAEGAICQLLRLSIVRLDVAQDVHADYPL